jgi:Rap1a immunity proteins
MHRRLLCAFVITAVLAAAPLRAQMIAKDISESGNRFLEVCSVIDKADRKERITETDLDEASFCTGFVMGVNDGTTAGIVMLKSFKSLSDIQGSMEDVSICLPEGVTAGQELRVLLKYIRAHPEQAHLPTAGLVLVAEYDAFPCPVTAPTPTPKPKQ